MKEETASRARSITWAASKQTYFTARVLVDKDLVDDFYRAYAYFRWADDIVDDPEADDDERLAFIERQKNLIESFFSGAGTDSLSPQEQMLADLVRHDRGVDSGLKSFINNMFAIIEFDARRRGRLVSGQELDWYTDSLGRSVTDGIQYFIGNAIAYPDSQERYLSARAAHIAHLLRDTIADTDEGFLNIPGDYLDEHGITARQTFSPAYRAWVRKRVDVARDNFRDGKLYLDRLELLRCKLAGYLYCSRFEGVLTIIERDGYSIRPSYQTRTNKLAYLVRLPWLLASVTIRHLLRR